MQYRGVVGGAYARRNSRGNSDLRGVGMTSAECWIRLMMSCVISVAFAACSDAGSVADADAHAAADVSVGPDADVAAPAAPAGLSWEAGEAGLQLFPRVRVAGTWLGSVDDCELEPLMVTCDLIGVGRLTAELTDSGAVVARLEATAAVTVEALALEGPLVLPGARAWLSNGFQSWSQAGALALAPEPSAAAITEALTAQGDVEVIRGGQELSWFHTWVSGDGPSLVAGAVTAGQFAPWAQAYTDGDQLAIRLGCGGRGDSITLASGEQLVGEAWHVALGGELQALLEGYAAVIPSRRDDVAPAADAGWNSWYELWSDVDEEAVLANASLARDVLADALPGAPPLRVVIDDGWQVAWGEWTANDKFPSGLAGTASALHAEGLEVGVWLAPLLVDADSELVAEHPGWFVGGVEFPHLVEGPMRVLDVTQPDAAAHLQARVTDIVGWGFDFLKIDFLFAGTWPGERHTTVTAMAAYGLALQLIREAAGEDVILLAVGAPGLPSLPWVDAWRVGSDIAVEPFGASWVFAPNQLRSVAARWPLCARTLCDADPVLLRAPLTQEEVDTGAWVVALSGGALFLSDDLRALPAERRGWGLDDGRAMLAVSTAPAVPEDRVPQSPPDELVSAIGDQFAGESHHLVPARWRLQDGRRLAINVGEVDLMVEGVVVPPHGARVLP